MNRNNIIRRQQIKNMVYSLIAFSIIFILFGAIVLRQVSTSLFSMLDNELMSSKSMMEYTIENGGIDFKRQPNPQAPPRNDFIPNLRSPKMIPIVRDSDGNIINFGNVNSTYYNQYLKDIGFDKNNLNKIVSIQITNQYYFRSLTIPLKDVGGNQIYLQLVINADSERALFLHISFIISISIALFIILSLLASFILSQVTMKPVKIAWDKQTEFVENVSHELRTPLTIIQNSLEMLFITPQQKIIDKAETLGMALNETARLSKLVTDMLTLARSDSTMTELMKDLFSVDMLVKTVCEPFVELAVSQEKLFLINLDCPVNIRADKQRIYQLLVILLDNALKYTNPNDSIMVSTELCENKICLTVSDTGIGISDNAMEKIFGRFYREDSARAFTRSGSGLGLSIASWIANSHGGNIKVRHNEPKGTIFTVKLPK